MQTPKESKPIAKSGSALMISQVGLSVVSVITTIFLARALSKPEFAMLAVLEILVSIFQFSEMGFVGVAVQQAPSKLNKEGQENDGLALIKGAVVYRTIVLLLMGAFTFVFAPFFSQLFLKNTDQTWAIRTLIPAAVGTVWLYTLQSVAQIKNDFYLIARWNFISGVLRAVLSILALIIFGYPAFLAAISVSVLISVIGFAWPLKTFLFNKVAPVPFGKTFRYGFPLYIRSFFRFGFTQYDQLLVATLLTPFDLASYNIARRLAKMVALVIDSFQTPVTIRMASLRAEDDTLQAAFFRKATRYTTFLFISFSMFMAAASPWIMRVYGGPKYTENWPLLAILALTQGVYSLYVVFSSAVFARLMPWAIMLSDGITGGVNFLLAPILISALGKNGVAWGQLLGFSIGILIAQLLLRGSQGFRFDWNGLGKIILPLVTACGLIVMGQLVYFTIWIVPVYILLGAAIYGFWMGRRFSDEDWDLIRTMVPAAFTPGFRKIQRVLQRHIVS